MPGWLLWWRSLELSFLIFQELPVFAPADDLVCMVIQLQFDRLFVLIEVSNQICKNSR